MERIKHKKYKYKTVSLFSGIGGFPCQPFSTLGKLKGFPSDWVQVVSDTQAYKQFGNAVTVDVVYAIANNLMKYIDENKIGEW